MFLSFVFIVQLYRAAWVFRSFFVPSQVVYRNFLTLPRAAADNIHTKTSTHKRHKMMAVTRMMAQWVNVYSRSMCEVVIWLGVSAWLTRQFR